MISRKFKAVMAAFAQEYGVYSTQSGALYKCCDATDNFLKFLHKYHEPLIAALDIKRFEFTIKSCTENGFTITYVPCTPEVEAAIAGK